MEEPSMLRNAASDISEGPYNLLVNVTAFINDSVFSATCLKSGLITYISMEEGLTKSLHWATTRLVQEQANIKR